MASNTFITKLFEEYAKCNDFIDRNAIKTLRFEGNLDATHQILGPIFKDAVLKAIIEKLKAHCLKPLLQGYEWSKWDSVRLQGAWPSTTRPQHPGQLESNEWKSFLA
ncbi:hypothetical protein EV1_037513 [Malus domestica]